MVKILRILTTAQKLFFLKKYKSEGGLAKSIKSKLPGIGRGQNPPDFDQTSPGQPMRPLSNLSKHGNGKRVGESLAYVVASLECFKRARAHENEHEGSRELQGSPQNQANCVI